MTATVSRLTQNFLESNSYNEVATTVGLVTVVLLLVLLTERELLRATGGPKIVTQAFGALVMPLLMAFAIMIVLRFIGFLR